MIKKWLHWLADKVVKFLFYNRGLVYIHVGEDVVIVEAIVKDFVSEDSIYYYETNKVTELYSMICNATICLVDIGIDVGDIEYQRYDVTGYMIVNN